MSEDFLLRLWIIRHGQTSWNNEGRCIGITDLPLSRYGRKAVDEISKCIDIKQCDAVFSSSAKRAVQTTKAIIKNSTLTPHYCDDLKEIDYGIWEGITWKKIMRNRNQEWKMWEQDPYFSNPYMGESLFDVEQRVNRFYSLLLEEHLHKTILLISHCGTMNIFLCNLFQLPLNVIWTYRLRPASFSEVCIYKEGPIIRVLNYSPIENLENILFEKSMIDFPIATELAERLPQFVG